MIWISQKKNQKLLENFNNDPFADVLVKTQNNSLHLVLSYLSIDSQYFNRVALDTSEIDLSHLPEKSLLRVLRALYGDELSAYSVKELVELYGIIEYLEIEEYKENIQVNILKNADLLNSLELLEFGLNSGILREKLKIHHFKNKLQTLSDSRNYLQLNKISKDNLTDILLGYSQVEGPNADQTINYILENYFGRNQISSFEFLQDPSLQVLRNIWEKYHHSITYIDQCRSTQEKIKQSQMMTGTINEEKMGNFGAFSMGSFSHIPQQIIEKDREIEQLQNTLKSRCQIIQSLKEEIQRAQEQKEAEHEEVPEFDDEAEKSMLQGVMKSKKQRQNFLQKEFETSFIEPAFDQARKIVNDHKEMKTMNRLNSRSKRIFNQ